jgi:hypothetical protein
LDAIAVAAGTHLLSSLLDPCEDVVVGNRSLDKHLLGFEIDVILGYA